jgi:LPXTG-motif cell wall-anchored protein
MTSADLAYLVFGLTLCVALAGIALFYFRRRRKDRVEAPKYEMLKDDE